MRQEGHFSLHRFIFKLTDFQENKNLQVLSNQLPKVASEYEVRSVGKNKSVQLQKTGEDIDEDLDLLDNGPPRRRSRYLNFDLNDEDHEYDHGGHSKERGTGKETGEGSFSL